MGQFFLKLFNCQTHPFGEKAKEKKLTAQKQNLDKNRIQLAHTEGKEKNDYLETKKQPDNFESIG